MGKLLTVVFTVLLAVSNPVSAEIEVEDLWLRESIPGQPNGAGFGVLRNTSDVDIFLVGASIDIAHDVEIHQHVMESGQMRMEQIEALMVPANESVRMQPGGYHLMLMNLKSPLIKDEWHDVTLIFNDGTTLELSVPVRPLVR